MPSTKLPYAVRRKKPARNASARAFQQRFDLVLQKRQQRAEHDRQSAVDHRGDLETETLPATGAFEHEDVAL